MFRILAVIVASITGGLLGYHFLVLGMVAALPIGVVLGFVGALLDDMYTVRRR